MTEHAYEVHIVGYGKTRLDALPDGFKKFDITSSQVCLSEIATAEVDNLKEGLEAFHSATKWLEKQKSRQALHIKLEQLQGAADVATLGSPLRTSSFYPLTPDLLNYDENLFVGAFGWDIHIDGRFNPARKDDLIRFPHNWVFLDYISLNGEPLSTLTRHFLNKKDCEADYKYVLKYLKSAGGFTGQIYWEKPVRYLVCES